MSHFFAALRQKLRRRRHDLPGDESGVTAIEFSLLAFPFFAIIGAILQTSVIFLASQVLESAVQDAAREVRTGQVQNSGSLESFRASVCGKLFGLFPDCNGLHIRVAKFDNFQSARVILPLDLNCLAPCNWTVEEEWDPGEARKTVVVQAHYRYPVAIPLGPIGMSNMGDGRRLLGSAAVFQNEPF